MTLVVVALTCQLDNLYWPLYCDLQLCDDALLRSCLSHAEGWGGWSTTVVVFHVGPLLRLLFLTTGRLIAVCLCSFYVVSWGIGLFLYQTLDAIDGKQARRTGMAGPLGEMFDHGLHVFPAVEFCQILIAVCLSRSN